MTPKKNNIYIIGAGVSGLVAAKVLEENGYSPIVLEAKAGIGGRVKTDMIAGYQLDRGFQVLLTAYPAVLKHLDVKALDLQKFRPGAVIFKKGKQHILGDPLRDVSLLFATLFSGIGTLSDKIKVLQLNRLVKGKTPQEIFEAEDQTTLSYLTKFGFSAKMIHQFFRPFFSGIFLETNLHTSSKMFQFIYKMFAEGYAALPKSGIGAVADQLFGKLSATTFQFNTKVNGVKDGEIQLSNGEILSSDFTILATEASPLLGHLITESAKWKSCDTLYFECPKQLIKSPLIGLIPDQEALINNIFFHSSLQLTQQPEKALLSVTIVKEHHLSQERLIEQVQKELHTHCGISDCSFLKQYKIPKALPDLDNVKYDVSVAETQYSPQIFLAGDTLLNGSLNAAILAGERAALGVINAIKEV